MHIYLRAVCYFQGSEYGITDSAHKTVLATTNNIRLLNMSSKNFAHLHVHTTYSLLDGISKRDELIKLTKEYGMPGMAVTEHGNLFNCVSFYRDAVSAGIVPIIGYEAYVAPDSRHNRTYAKKGEALEDAKNGDLTLYAYHLTILSKNRQGYENLKQLSTLAYKEGFYRKPRIDDELLDKHKDGLIVLSGCLAGKIARLVLAGNKAAAITEIDKLRFRHGENFYLELMAHNQEEETLLREALLDISKTHGIPTVLTGDSHFTHHGDELAHTVALNMGSDKTLSSPDKWTFNGDGYWYKKPSEMWKIAEDNDIPDESLSNTVNIVKSIDDYGFKLASKSKKFVVPLFREEDHIYTDDECHQLLEYKSWQGLAERGLSDSEIHRARIMEELAMMRLKNFSSYFLIISDIIDFMRRENIIVPIGRGCLRGDINVLTSNGFKRLDMVDVGDSVYTSNGYLNRVYDKMSYDITEETISINSAHSFGSINLTADHKVLAYRPKLRSYRGRTKIDLKTEMKSAVPEWIEAKDLTLDHLIYTPYPKDRPVRVPASHIDLASFTKFQYDDNKIYVRRSSKGSMCVRTIAKDLGINRMQVRRVANGKGSKCVEQLSEYLASTGSTLEDLRTANRYCVTEVPRYVEANEEFYYFLGRWVGDGWVSKNKLGIAFHSDDKSISIIESYLTKIGYKCRQIKHAKRNLIQLVCYSTEIAGLLVHIFPEYKNTSGTKYLGELTYLPDYLLKSVIRGYIDSDGSIEKSIGTRECIDTTSRRLALEMKQALLYLHVPSSIVTRKPYVRTQDGKEYNCNEAYKVRFKGIFTLKSQSPFIREDGYFSKILGLSTTKDTKKVYDISVENDPCYLTTNGIVHNSSLGSLVCYSLFITGLDPIEHGIPFERFINEGRKDLPDVDTDISKENRGKVLQYIAKKYGIDRVAHIVTFQSLRPKAALDNVGRVLDVPAAIRRQATADIHDDPTSADTLIDLIEHTPSAKQIVESVPDWLDIATRLEGNNRNLGSHAAGIVISNDSLIDSGVPLLKDADDGIATTQLDMDDIAELGLLKLDMLGLKTMDVMASTIKQVKDRYGIDIDWHRIPLNDAQTYATITSGKYVSIFQYDSPGMRNLAKQLQPDNFDHLVAINCLYRPGPMKKPKDGGQSILEMYLDRRHGRAPIEYWHPELEPVFKNTLGLCLFQESLMGLAQVISGFNKVEADEYRAAVGKKDREKFIAAQDKLIQRGIECGRDPKFMKDLADKVSGFARYGWNIGHSKAYSYISYVTAWLETHYPHEYYVSLLNTADDDSKKLAVLVASILQKNIKLETPNINKSIAEFSTDGTKIYMGLHSINKIGEIAVSTIIADRTTNGEYRDFMDFMIRMRDNSKFCNRTVKENLVKAGAFNWDTSLTLKDKISNIEKIQDCLKKYHDKLGLEETIKKIEEKTLFTKVEFSQSQLLEMEKSVLNFYISSHPALHFCTVFSLFPNANFILPSQLNDQTPGDVVLMAGVVTAKNNKTTQAGSPYLELTVSDNAVNIKLRIWSPYGPQISPQISTGQMVIVVGSATPDKFIPTEMSVKTNKIVPIAPNTGMPINAIVARQEYEINSAALVLGSEVGAIKPINNGYIGMLKYKAYIKPENVSSLHDLNLSYILDL